MSTCKILIVDDEPLLGQPLKRTLETAGYQVRLAQSGAEALEAFAGESFDLLLEDLRLPDVDGLEIMREALERISAVHRPTRAPSEQYDLEEILDVQVQTDALSP